MSNELNLALHATSFIHIDTTLKSSLYKRLIWGSSFLVFVFIISLLPWAFTYKILVGAVALVSLWFGQIYSCHLLSIASLDTNDKGKKQTATHTKFDFLTWQVQWVRGVVKVPRNSEADIWQATLIDMTDMGCMLILKFHLIESPHNKIVVSIWQDQVDSDTWRQLKTLAR